MSRIGRKPIAIPAGVKVTVDGSKVTVAGPKGTLDSTEGPDRDHVRSGQDHRRTASGRHRGILRPGVRTVLKQTGDIPRHSKPFLRFSMCLQPFFLKFEHP